jgi:hypothetical protein
MDVDQEQDVDSSEKLVDPDEKKKLECTPKIIIIIIIANLVFIAVNIILIHFFSLSKVDYMSTIMKDFVIDYTKSAITDKRIMHLIKSEGNSNSSVRFKDLSEQIQFLVLNATYDFLNSEPKFKKLLEDMNNKTFVNIFPAYDPSQGQVNAIEDHYRVLTQEENWIIYKLMDQYDLKTINDAITEKKGDKYKKQLKIMILYGLINLPFQVFYFNNDNTIKDNFQKKIIDKIKANVTKIIDQSLQSPEKDKILMVLGCNQEEELERINASYSGYKTPINLIDVGLRTQFANSELESSILKENLNYYLDETNFALMKNCSAKNLKVEEFKEFINKLKNINDTIINGDLTDEKIDKIHKLFEEYLFSVETANTVINYIKFDVSKEKIKIIRLGTNQINEDYVYNNDDIFILYNVADISKSGDTSTTRATTYSNAKAIKYLREEYKNFLTEEKYKNIVLVSSKDDAERQLEAFNIASNISEIKDANNEILKWNEVVWNQSNNKEYDTNELVNVILETMVKSYNLIATNLMEKLKNDKENEYLYNLANDYTDLIKKYQNIAN